MTEKRDNSAKKSSPKSKPVSGSTIAQRVVKKSSHTGSISRSEARKSVLAVRERMAASK